MVVAAEQILTPFFRSQLLQHPGCHDSILAGVHKDHNLVTTFQHIAHLFIGDVINILSRLLGARLSLHSDEMLLKGYRSERRVEEEHASHFVNLQKVGHIDIVRECGRETNDANQRLSAFDLTLRTSNQRFNDSTTFIMQHVDLINNEQSHLLNKLCVSSTLASHNVPFFRGCDDDLGIHDLTLGQLHVTSQFAGLDSQPGQSFAQLFRNFSCQGLHWGDVNNLEVINLDSELCGSRVFQWIG